MNLTERLQEAFDKRVCGTAMLPASDLLSAMSAIEQLEETIAQQAEAIRVKNESLFDACSTFAEYAQIHSAKQPPDTRKSAFNFDRANQMNAAITIQPSPEHLEAWYKEMVGEPIAWNYELTEEAFVRLSVAGINVDTPLHAIKPFKGE